MGLYLIFILHVAFNLDIEFTTDFFTDHCNLLTYNEGNINLIYKLPQLLDINIAN